MKRLLKRISLLILSCVAALHMELGSSSVALKGRPAPDFVLKSISGDNLRLSEYKGQVVMINFWATWCGPCRQEMPDLDALYKRYERFGFVLLGVNIDENDDKAQRMARELQISFPVLFDRDKEVSRLYQVDAMPTTVLIDQDGTVRHVHRGFRTGYTETYQEQLRKLLRE